MKQVLIIGAFDRYNYGDLLFPIIIEMQLKTHQTPMEFSFYGIVDSDLSTLGGKPTESIKHFYKKCQDSKHKASVIVAGGEAIAVTWNSLLVALSSTFQKTRRYQHHIDKVIDLNRLAKFIIGGKTALPFVFNKGDFKQVDRVIFNSLGGSEIDNNVFQKHKLLRQKLQNVDYFSVRDEVTQRNLAHNAIETLLYPDSAILMSKFFPVQDLVKRASREVQAFIDTNKRKYIFFQINRNHARGHESEIAKELDKIVESTGATICLCPIGKALNHDDHEALKEISRYLNHPATFFEDVTIWDIMYLIASSACYIGTSLHGAITAMSFAVPYVGLKVKKLDSYLHTWGVEHLRQVIDFQSIYNQYRTAIATDSEALKHSRDLQIERSEESFNKISAIIGH